MSASTGGRRGIYMIRGRDGITAALGTMLHERREDRFCVVLHVSHAFPFDDPPHDVILVSGGLTADGVRIDEPGPPRPGSTTWWPVADVERAWEAVETHGLPWLERFSRVDALIEHFERGIEPRGLVETLRRFVRPDADVRPPRRKFLLWLALLYERDGELSPARDYLSRYVRAWGGVGGRKKAELKRIEGHLAELRGTGSIAAGVTRDEFLGRFGKVWKRVFSGKSVRDGAFVEKTWEQVLIPDFRATPRPETDGWLRAVREEAGDELLVFTEDESDDRHAVNVLVPVSVEGVEDALTRTELTDVYAFFTGFGPSGRWGIVFEEYFACLAGDQEFVQACVEASGGRDAVRARFIRWADTEWQGSDVHLRTVLERVGWSGP